MAGTMQEIFLRATTALFAQNVCSVVKVMTGHTFSIFAKSLTKGFVSYPPGFITFMHFSGNIQGDFSIAMDESTAFKITNIPIGSIASDAKKNAAEILGEVLNTATGATLIELEKKYGNLTVISPYFVFGEITLPNIMSGTVEIQSESGNITCLVSLNKVPLHQNPQSQTS
jgi:CheY-specific phosphatase CheX